MKKRIAIVTVLLASAWLLMLSVPEQWGNLQSAPNVNTYLINGFTANDLNGRWNMGTATRITLDGSKTHIQGRGANFDGKNVRITQSGLYTASGSLTDGSLVIDADEKDKIWLGMENVSIHRENGAAIMVERADKVFITLTAGSENTLSGGANGQVGEPDGVIYSRDDLTLNGTGKLTVTSSAGHGIVCNDNFVLVGGNVNITAVRDGIHVNDSARFADMNLTIVAGDDGVSVSSDRIYSQLLIASGILSIPVCYEGLEAVNVVILDGKVDIVPRDDGINAPGWGIPDDVRISGGFVRIVNRNGRDADGIDSNYSVHIDGGDVQISVPNDGSSNAVDYGGENGGIFEINGGTVLACGSAGMAERVSPFSAQAAVMYNFSPATQAGECVVVSEVAGKELLRWDEVPHNFNSIIFSSPELKEGDTYVLKMGEREVEFIPSGVNMQYAGGVQSTDQSVGNRSRLGTSTMRLDRTLTSEEIALLVLCFMLLPVWAVMIQFARERRLSVRRDCTSVGVAKALSRDSGSTVTAEYGMSTAFLWNARQESSAQEKERSHK